ncbi:hypothetical protein [Litchfieldia alkalitelluris]|uniref:hypothetical protein n=1 Tax=Litchfieldia alkalitelluris TaxID=304268 RepID=UPI000995DF81|nr:hypothetical protein [Litchfieldia alkalitelluris]
MLLYALNVNKKSIVISTLLFVVSFFPILYGANYYKHLSDSGITYSNIYSLEKQEYSWKEVEKVIYHLANKEEKMSSFEIYFKDGEKITLDRDGKFAAIYYWFTKKIREFNISYIGS